MKLKRLNSFWMVKLVQVIFHAWVVWYVCILNTANKMTLLNVLNFTFSMFFPALSSTSLLLSAFYGPDIHFFAIYETTVLVAMVIANTVIQICRSKIILGVGVNNAKKLYESFFCTENESEHTFLGPVMIIAFQALFVMLLFCRKMYSPEPSKIKLRGKNDCSILKTSEDSCMECNENSNEKCNERENNFTVHDNFFSEDMLSQLENIEEYVIDQNANVIEDSYTNNENNCKDKEGEEKLGDVVGSKEKKKIKPSPRLCRVPGNSSNPNKELDSTNSEIYSQNDSCFSLLDTEEDMSLSTLRMDNSTYNQSVFSVTDGHQFAKDLSVGSSSSPKSKNDEDVSVSLNDNLEISVQFPMDLTPQKSKNIPEVEESDIKPSSTHTSSDSSNLDSVNSTKSNECEKDKYSLMLKEFKLEGDIEVEGKFRSAVNVFEMVNNCNFLEWLFKTTHRPNDISKFIRLVVGKRNKEKVEKSLREWQNAIVTSCKQIDIQTNPNRKFHKEIQLAFMKNDSTYKLLRRNGKRVLRYIEDLSRSDKIDEKKLTECYDILANMDDDHTYMRIENKEYAEKEKNYVKYLTLENTLELKRKEKEKEKEKVGTISSQKDLNLGKLHEDNFPVTRKDIFKLHGLELNPASFTENRKIIIKKSKSIPESVEKKETTDGNKIENISSERTTIKENNERNCEDQEKNVNVKNKRYKNKMDFALDSKTYTMNLTNEDKYTSKAESQGTKSAFNTEKRGDSVTSDPSCPISIKVNDGINDSDSEDEYNDVLEFFEKIQKSIDEKKSLSAEEVFKKYGRVYYGGNSFLEAKKYITEKHAKNNKRRKEQEVEMRKTIEDLYVKLNKVNPQKTRFQEKLAILRMEIDETDPSYY